MLEVEPTDTGQSGRIGSPDRAYQKTQTNLSVHI